MLAVNVVIFVASVNLIFILRRLISRCRFLCRFDSTYVALAIMFVCKQWVFAFVIYLLFILIHMNVPRSRIRATCVASPIARDYNNCDCLTKLGAQALLPCRTNTIQIDACTVHTEYNINEVGQMGCVRRGIKWSDECVRCSYLKYQN